MYNFLKKAQKAYTEGNPIISDEVFDALADRFGFYEVGSDPESNSLKHFYPLYSLKKVYEEDGVEYPKDTYIVSPKLDGAAVSLVYVEGTLVRALTRGNGVEGVDITDKFISTDLAPKAIPKGFIVQVDGEVVAPKEIENARNYAAGALGLKDLEEFKKKGLTFIAYNVRPSFSESYSKDMKSLQDFGFNSVTQSSWDQFPQDGKVVRIDSNEKFEELGYTAKHPRGAFAIKKKANIPIVETTLREVIWQTGKGGKVTPVAIFDPITIEDATITKASLHNVGMVEELDLDIGDKILVTRAGAIIPQVVGKV